VAHVMIDYYQTLFGKEMVNMTHIDMDILIGGSLLTIKHQLALCVAPSD